MKSQSIPKAMKYVLYLISLTFICFACSKNKSTTVGIQPFDTFQQPLTDTIAHAIANFYHVKTTILPQREIPAAAFVNIKTPRYKADKIIKLQAQNKPDSLDYIVSLTNFDISTDKKDEWGFVKKPVSKYADWGIMGLAYRPGNSCIVSTFRLKNESERKFIERLKKVCIHEFGHNLGLPHCASKECVMRDAAETIKTIDGVKLALCAKCKEKIQ